MRTTGHIFCPLETEASHGHCQILSILDAPPLCSAPGGALQPREVGMDTALRGGSLAACTLKGLERRKLCVLRFFLVSFVLLYEALSDCAKFPCLTLTLGQCSRHQHQQNCCSFYCTYCIYWDSLQRELYEE